MMFRGEASCNILNLDYANIDVDMEENADFSLIHSAQVF